MGTRIRKLALHLITDRFLHFSTIILWLFHFSFFWCFLLVLKIPEMTLINLLSVGIYSLAFWSIGRRSVLFTFRLIYLELFGYYIISVIMFGTRSGFYLSCMVLVAFCFYYYRLYRMEEKNEGTFHLNLYLLLDVAGMLFVEIWAYYKEPLHQLPKRAEFLFRTSIFSMLLLAMICILYSFWYQILQTEQRLLIQNDRYSKQARIDYLTQLHNRRGIEDFLQQAERQMLPYAVVMLDIDDFKKVNDTYGHEFGDKALLYIADVLRANVRSLDIICRWGGEEFLIFLPGADIEAARTQAERIRCEIEKGAVSDAHTTCKLTVTLGVAVSKDGSNSRSIVDLADKRMYCGKAGTKNCVISE